MSAVRLLGAAVVAATIVALAVFLFVGGGA